MVYIGIDLGTTYSCVAVMENGQPLAIPCDDDGQYIMPCIVAYFNNETVVGSSALWCDTDSANVLYDSKRLIGCESVHNLPVANQQQLWAFNVDTQNNSAGYILNMGESTQKFVRPEEVSSQILKNLKSFAEKYLKKPVTGAVVTIPAQFNEKQRAATKVAVEMAGLELKHLLEEPIASALAYNHRKRLGDSMCLIIDFGGGTLDVGIVEIQNEIAKVKTLTGNSHLGGQDIDARIMNYFIEECTRRNFEYDIQDPNALKLLRIACRKAKEVLASRKSYDISPYITNAGDPKASVKLTQAKLNKLCDDIFVQIMITVDEAMKMVDLTPDRIDHVILAGGSTRILRIQQMLEEKFGNGKVKLFDINSNEAVAFGAAILADAIEKEKQIPLTNNTTNELARNINDLQLGGDNSFDNSHKVLFYLWYLNNDENKGGICLFNSYTWLVEEIARFNNWYAPYQVATTQNQIFGINGEDKAFEIYDLNTREISRGPDPPEWRRYAPIVYFKDKLYYFCGRDPKTRKDTNRVDVLIDGKWQTGPAFLIPSSDALAITCDEILYVFEKYRNRKIYRLSDDEREWIEIGKLPEYRGPFGAASLNGKIYITGGYCNELFKSCLCFDPSAPVDSRISRIADMNYKRYSHPLIVANEKLYAIGGFQQSFWRKYCNSIERYDPQTNEWREKGDKIELINISIDEELCKKFNELEVNSLNLSKNEDKSLVYLMRIGLGIPISNSGLICQFYHSSYEIHLIEKCLQVVSFQVAIGNDKVYLIANRDKTFKIYDLQLNRKISGPNPPEWRLGASVAFHENKLYYIGGTDTQTEKDSTFIDTLINGTWQRGPNFPISISQVQTISHDGCLYVFDGMTSHKIYRLSENGQEWIEMGHIGDERYNFSVSSLNGKIYITGGTEGWDNGRVLKSCLCFDPSAPVDSRTSRIACMNYAKFYHSLVAANGKLYAIGGVRNLILRYDFCNSIEEYDPQTDKWLEVGKLI